MSIGLAAAEANALLDQLIVDYPWIRLHIGDPGASGTANIASNNTMKNTSTSWAAASGGSKSTNTAISWTLSEVNANEDYTHYTMWDDSVPTTFGFSGTVVADAVQASGDTFDINSGGFTISLATAT